jgi:hypothetical protein
MADHSLISTRLAYGMSLLSRISISVCMNRCVLGWKIRKSNKNLGVDWTLIRIELEKTIG